MLLFEKQTDEAEEVAKPDRLGQLILACFSRRPVSSALWNKIL